MRQPVLQSEECSEQLIKFYFPRMLDWRQRTMKLGEARSTRECKGCSGDVRAC